MNAPRRVTMNADCAKNILDLCADPRALGLTSGFWYNVYLLTDARKYVTSGDIQYISAHNVGYLWSGCANLIIMQDRVDLFVALLEYIVLFKYKPRHR